MGFSVKLKDNRLVITCCNSKTLDINDFVIDTGAKMTCCNSVYIDSTLTKDDLVNSEQKLIGGIVQGQQIILYKYHIDEFVFGPITVYDKDIWVSFDNNLSEAILGMDILQDVLFLYNPIVQTMFIFDDSAKFYNYQLKKRVQQHQQHTEI